MSLVHNERTKLLANGINTLAAGTIIAGSITPVVAIAYGLRSGPAGVNTGFIVALTLVWLLTGIALHLVARAILGRLVP